MMTKYYIPLAVSNLSIWLSQGVIKPCSLIPCWNEDIQFKMPKNCLLLLEKKQYPYQCDCMLEVYLLEKDNKLKKRGEYIEYNGCIPQSRIQYIYFKSNAQKARAINNISDGNAFINDSFCTVLECEDVLLKVGSDDGERIQDLDKLDGIMGAFCMLSLVMKKHAGPYSFLFEMISKYSTKDVLDLEKYIHKKTKIDDYYSKCKSLIDKKSLKYWLAESNNPFKLDNYNFPVFKELKDEDLISAILGIYGSNDGKKKSTDEFIKDCTTGQFADKKDILPIVGFLFGLKEKYNLARSFYRIGEENIKYKFDMSIPFDRFMLECIYQFCFEKNYAYAKILLEENPPKYENDKITLFGEVFTIKKKEELNQEASEMVQKDDKLSGDCLSSTSVEFFIKTLQEKLIELNGYKEQLDKCLSENQNLIVQLSKVLESQENQLVEQQELLNTKEQELIEKTNRINELEVKNTRLEAEMKKLQENCSAFSQTKKADKTTTEPSINEGPPSCNNDSSQVTKQSNADTNECSHSGSSITPGPGKKNSDTPNKDESLRNYNENPTSPTSGNISPEKNDDNAQSKSLQGSLAFQEAEMPTNSSNSADSHKKQENTVTKAKARTSSKPSSVSRRATSKQAKNKTEDS